MRLNILQPTVKMPVWVSGRINLRPSSTRSVDRVSNTLRRSMLAELGKKQKLKWEDLYL